MSLLGILLEYLSENIDDSNRLKRHRIKHSAFGLALRYGISRSKGYTDIRRCLLKNESNYFTPAVGNSRSQRGQEDYNAVKGDEIPRSAGDTCGEETLEVKLDCNKNYEDNRTNYNESDL